MKTYLAILRGINVSGTKLIKMTDLQSLSESIGLKTVRTYIQSGNVIFEAEKDDNLAKKIEQKILEKYQFEVPVLVKTMEDMEKLIKENPFIKDETVDIQKLHVTFMENDPDNNPLDKIKGLEFGKDHYYITGKSIYLYCPDGYGRTKLNNNFFESKLKVRCTTRNWKTVNEIMKIMKA